MGAGMITVEWNPETESVESIGKKIFEHLGVPVPVEDPTSWKIYDFHWQRYFSLIDSHEAIETVPLMKELMVRDEL